MAKRGGQPKFTQESKQVLLKLVEENPTATIGELRAELRRLLGLSVCHQTLVKALNELGVKRQSVKVVSEEADSEPHYGYTDAHRHQAPEQTYPSSLTDREWALVHDLFEQKNKRGFPPKYPRRLMVDACCYVVRSGCTWRMLPQEFPPWKNVYRTFRRWSDQGLFEQMHDRLRALWREQVGKDLKPTLSIIDAQSTRGSPQGGETGYDAGKKVKGRKRHIVVDSLGLLLAVSVTAANIQDRAGAHPVMEKAMSKYPTIEKVIADSGYAGKCAQTLSQMHDINVEIVRHPANKNVGRWVSADQADLFEVQADAAGFVVLPKRWVVERTHAWIERARRLMIHHDRLPSVAEAWAWLAGSRMLARRLTA